MSTFPGQTISHYAILEHLGAGGMGVVYKARDLKLDRPVALKFLPADLTRDAEARQRLIHEARAASTLLHPNISVVHDVDETPDGQMFIVMEYIDGETLRKKLERGPVGPGEALDIAIQIAEGLAGAHEHGITHRDLKPANIMITNDGVAKIVDFGLAKLSGQTVLTKAGSRIGTAAYMSPEQTRGDQVDQRTDLWSLGVVLYEMLSGELPFRGEHELALMYEILQAKPRHLEPGDQVISSSLKEILLGCLEKTADKRIQSAREIASLLREARAASTTRARESSRFPDRRPGNKRRFVFLSAGLLGAGILAGILWLVLLKPAEHIAPSGVRTIAVLPFKTLRYDEETDFLGFSLANEVSGRLAPIKSLIVRPAETARQMQQGDISPTRIGAELGADVVLTATYLKSGDRLRITPQLLDVAANRILWSGPIDVRYRDIAAIQDTIAQTIVRSLRLQLSQEERTRLGAGGPVNPLAYEYYLRAEGLQIRMASDEEIRLRLLERSLELDSTYAPSWASYGRRLRYRLVQGGNVEAHAKRAERALQKALELNPDFAPALGQWAILKSELGELEAALSLGKRAVEISPTWSGGYVCLGMVLRSAGFLDESIRAHRHALALEDSFSSSAAGYRLQLLRPLLYTGQYKEALDVVGSVESIRKRRGTSESAEFLFYAGFAFLYAGGKEKALGFFDSLTARDPQNTWALLARGYGCGLRKDPGGASAAVAALRSRTILGGELLYRLAHLSLLAGDTLGALADLNRAVSDGWACPSYIAADPLLRALHGREEFQRAVRAAQERHKGIAARREGFLPEEL